MVSGSIAAPEATWEAGSGVGTLFLPSRKKGRAQCQGMSPVMAALPLLHGLGPNQNILKLPGSPNLCELHVLVCKMRPTRTHGLPDPILGVLFVISVQWNPGLHLCSSAEPHP